MRSRSSESIRSWAASHATAHLRLFRTGGFLTIMLVALGLLLAGGGRVAQGQEFQPGSYSGTRLRGDKVTLTFDHKGKFILTDKDGKTLVEGTYKVMKDQIEFTDEKGPMASKGAKPGKYKWKLKDKALNLTKVDDESEGRSRGITGTTWTLEK